MDRRLQAFGGRWSHLQPFRGISGSSCTYLWKHTWIVDCKPLVAYVDRRSQAFGGRWSRLQAFGGWRGSPIASLWLQMQSFASLGGIRGSSFTSKWWLIQYSTSLWWQVESYTILCRLAWIAVCKPLVADGVIYKPLVAYVDRRSQAFGRRSSHLPAFGGIRGSSFTSLWWQMESFTSLSWLVWIAVHKPLVADRVIYKPLVAYVDRRVHSFGGIRRSSFERPSWLTWIAVHKPLVADEVVYKPFVAYVDRR